jgi:hypothetical protein
MVVIMLATGQTPRGYVFPRISEIRSADLWYSSKSRPNNFALSSYRLRDTSQRRSRELFSVLVHPRTPRETSNCLTGSMASRRSSASRSSPRQMAGVEFCITLVVKWMA